MFNCRGCKITPSFSSHNNDKIASSKPYLESVFWISGGLLKREAMWTEKPKFGLCRSLQLFFCGAILSIHFLG